ncbi:MAG: patatin-like phospholipase family protein [Candidatus Omnitrophota bacterium]
MPFFKKKKVGLALGGGAARGIANIGVLKVLEKERVPIDLIVGSSIGSLIGAAYSLGVPTHTMEKYATKFTWQSLADFSISRTAILRGKRLENIIDSFLGSRGFKDLRIPLAITTTDIESGEEVLHTKGNLKKLIKASCSWPGIFPPVTVEGRMLGDGGIRNSIPVKMAKKLGADIIIAIDIGFCVKKGKLTNLFQMFIQSIQILGEELDKYQSKQADIVIKPKLHDMDQFAFHRAREAIHDGERAARAALSKIREKIGLNFDIWKP